MHDSGQKSLGRRGGDGCGPTTNYGRLMAAGRRMQSKSKSGCAGGRVPTLVAKSDDKDGAPGDILLEIVHEHAHRRFLLPSFAGKRVAARRANASVS